MGLQMAMSPSDTKPFRITEVTVYKSDSFLGVWDYCVPLSKLSPVVVQILS